MYVENLRSYQLNYVDRFQKFPHEESLKNQVLYFLSSLFLHLALDNDHLLSSPLPHLQFTDSPRWNLTVELGHDFTNFVMKKRLKNKRFFSGH